MTRGEIWKDFFKKVIVPVLLTAFLFYWEKHLYAKRRNKLFLCMTALRCSFRYQKNVFMADSDKS